MISWNARGGIQHNRADTSHNESRNQLNAPGRTFLLGKFNLIHSSRLRNFYSQLYFHPITNELPLNN